MEIGNRSVDLILSALGQQLEVAKKPFEPVIIGGSALIALGFVERPTKDVDVVGLLERQEILSAKPMPQALASAIARVGRDFELKPNWMNSEPSHLLTFGLPAGFTERLVSRVYGPFLTVHFCSRLDQIHFKLYAMVDQGGGRHEADLRALSPSNEELLKAAAWAGTQDPSEGFAAQLHHALLILEDEGETSGT